MARSKTKAARPQVKSRSNKNLHIVMVYTTYPDLKSAKKSAELVVESRLAACANIFNSKVLSVYRWKGKVKNGFEVVVIFKTTTKRSEKLIEHIELTHPYDVPAVLVYTATRWSQKYSDWVEQQVQISI